MAINEFTKQPSEKYPVSIDFSNSLSSGEVINSINVVAVNVATNEDVTATIIDSTNYDDDTVGITVKAGTNKDNYKITVKVTSSFTNVYEEDLFMNVFDI